MNVREAILKAANQIERWPESYDFAKGTVPECGSTGCALGWIGHFMGLQGKAYSAPLYEGLNSSSRGPSEFYEEMTRLEGEYRGWMWGAWPRSAMACARNLRAYADKHYPAPEPSFAANLMTDLARLPFHEDEEDECEEEECPALTI